MKEAQLRLPCYILKQDIFEDNIKDFKQALNVYFMNSIIGYSFKTNSLPYIISLAKSLECYAETVSDTEYNLALKMGYDPKQIIFNGPAKGKDLFMKAIKEGSIVNIDSRREVAWLKEMADQGISAEVGLRVNIDIEKKMPNQTLTGKKGGRFGFSKETGEAARMIAEIEKIPGMFVTGLHMHLSSKTKAVEVFCELAEQACEIAREENIQLKYLDIGGGFFGGADQGQAYRAYTEAIYGVMKKNHMEEILLVVEPGASVVATAIDYMVEVIDVKETNYERFVVTNGSRLHIDPFFHKEQYQFTLKCDKSKTKNKQIICGLTCMENDRIMELTEAAELKVGDVIVFHVVGAYTLSFNSFFIEYFPVVYAHKEERYIVIRDKWDVDEYVQKCKWEGVK